MGRGSVLRCPLSLQASEGTDGLDVPDSPFPELAVDPEGLSGAQTGPLTGASHVDSPAWLPQCSQISYQVSGFPKNESPREPDRS